MAEYSANAVQTVAANGSVIFTEAPVPCKRGLIRHRDETGAFLLKGYVAQSPCGCGESSAEYLCMFGANIAIPTGGTVEEISLALSIDGAVIPSSTMIVTPAAVEQYFNVSCAVNAQIWRGCCETLSIVNTSEQPILVQNANIVISRPDLAVTR